MSLEFRGKRPNNKPSFTSFVSLSLVGEQLRRVALDKLFGKKPALYQRALEVIVHRVFAILVVGIRVGMKTGAVTLLEASAGGQALLKIASPVLVVWVGGGSGSCYSRRGKDQEEQDHCCWEAAAADEADAAAELASELTL